MFRSLHLELAKWHWERQLAPGDTAIDATCGNGQDTLFLAKLPLSALFALDIQLSAIEKTRKRLTGELSDEELRRVHLCHMPHDDLRKLPVEKAPRLIVYNLGYLPGGDKSITTKAESTLASIDSALSILGDAGAVSITCYPGHEEGKKEEEAVLEMASSLPTDRWEVRHHRWLNRPRSPSLLWIRLKDAAPHP
jgi:SAM-dependent methyltransferase